MFILVPLVAVLVLFKLDIMFSSSFISDLFNEFTYSVYFEIAYNIYYNPY